MVGMRDPNEQAAYDAEEDIRDAVKALAEKHEWELGDFAKVIRAASDAILSPFPRTQAKILDWAVRSFGECARNLHERTARLVEEAVECAQAVEVPEEVLVKIVRSVYRKPPGELSKEIGGVALTLEGLAEAAGVCVQEEGDREWRRASSLSADYLKGKHAAKVAGGTSEFVTDGPDPDPLGLRVKGLLLANEILDERTPEGAAAGLHLVARQASRATKLAKITVALAGAPAGIFCGKCEKDPDGYAGRCASCGEEF